MNQEIADWMVFLAFNIRALPTPAFHSLDLNAQTRFAPFLGGGSEYSGRSNSTEAWEPAVRSSAA